jgi:hypothetical protein
VALAVNGTQVLTCTGNFGGNTLSPSVKGHSLCLSSGAGGGNEWIPTASTGPAITVDNYYAQAMGVSDSGFPAWFTDYRITYVPPTSAGYNSGFSHTGGGANYQDVDETAAPDTTDYIYATTVGVEDDYVFSYTPPTGYQLKGVTMDVYCKAGASAPQRLSLGHSSGVGNFTLYQFLDGNAALKTSFMMGVGNLDVAQLAGGSAHYAIKSAT